VPIFLNDRFEANRLRHMSVSQSFIVPPHVPADVASFARVLVAAARTWQMYSARHPASFAALERLSKAIETLQPYPGLTIGVTPKTLLVNGDAIPSAVRVAEAAEMLHEHDVLRLRFPSPSTPDQLADLLTILTHDPDTVRARGGPARMWAELGHRSVVIDQIDFEALMADRKSGTGGRSSTWIPAASSATSPATDPTARDGIWDAIVRSISSGQPTKGLSVQRRLQEIARSVEAIEALIRDAALDEEGPGTFAMTVSAQAASVLTAFQRLVRAVQTESPDQVDDTLRNLTEAASHLEPQLVMNAVAESAESGVGAEVTTAMGRWFDDEQVAQLLARSLAAEGKATSRYAAALSTLVPDPARQQRVLRLSRDYATSNLVGDEAGFDATWKSLEQMLRGPGDTAYASTEYSVSLEDAESRSYQLSLTTPAQMDGWIRTVSSESIRSMSAGLLLDLLGLEERPGKIFETADDLALLVDDLLMSCDTAESERVVLALCTIVAGSSPSHAEAASRALAAIARSEGLRDMSAALADADDARLAWFDRFCHRLGAPVLDGLVPAIETAPEGEGRRRLAQVIASFGDSAIEPLCGVLNHTDWLVRRAALHCIGRVGTDGAIAALEPLVSGADTRLAHEAVVALMHITRPAALEPVAAALRDGRPELRHLVVDALGASRDRRAAALLLATLDGLDPVGRGHALAMRVLIALRLVGDDEAVPAVADVLRGWNWLGLVKTNRVKRVAVSVLVSIKTAASQAALAEALSSGDILARMQARRAQGPSQ